MTRPLVPRAPKLRGVQPITPWVALAVLGVGIATSAGFGLYVSDGGVGGGVGGGGGRSSAAARQLGPSGSVALVVPAARADRAALPAAAVASGHSVQMVNFAYAPQVITVTVGDSITWTNQDEAPHTVTTTSGPQSISSPMLSKGQSFTFTFSAPGTYAYYCTVHPDMRAQVVVNPAPAAPSTPSVTTKTSAPPAVPSPTHSAAPATTHSAAPSASHSDHAASSSTAGAPPISSMSSMPPKSSASSAPPASAPSSGTSPAVAAAAPTISASSAAPAPATDAAALPGSAVGTAHSVSPTLVLAGLTAGATIYCLLLVASRRPQPETGTDDDEGS